MDNDHVLPLMASTFKDLSSLMTGILNSGDVSTSINNSDENTYFEDSDIKYNCISAITEQISFSAQESSTKDSIRYDILCDKGSSKIISPTNERIINVLSSSTDSSPGTFFEDSGIRYVVYCDESFEVIELVNAKSPSPPRTRSVILSSTDSSTGTFFDDSGIKYVAYMGK